MLGKYSSNNVGPNSPEILAYTKIPKHTRYPLWLVDKFGEVDVDPAAKHAGNDEARQPEAVA